MKASPRWPVTSPPVTQHCMDAIRGLLTTDLTRRLGSVGLSTFTDHPFFSTLDFEALENKEIPPVFVPSSEKTNFDATYDLEELLLEEAPLEARTRRQKPRERLKDDATAKEIREDELHKTIEKLFEPFDYTTVVYDKYPGAVDGASGSAGPPPDCVRPSINSSRLDAHDDMGPEVSLVASQKSAKSTVFVGSPATGGGSPTFYTSDDMHAPAQVGSQESMFEPGRPRTATKGKMKNESPAGGVQMVLDETGSWTTLADKSTAAPPKQKPSGMLGFLSKRKGRVNNPKPQERGVLGREGARVIIA